MTVNIGGLWVSSVYAPYSEGLPPKAAIKRRVAWLDRLRDHVLDVGYHDRDSVLCGDFNVKVRADGPPKGDYYSEAVQISTASHIPIPRKIRVSPLVTAANTPKARPGSIWFSLPIEWRSVFAMCGWMSIRGPERMHRPS